MGTIIGMVKILENWHRMNIPREAQIPVKNTVNVLSDKQIKSGRIDPGILEKIESINLFRGDWEEVRNSMGVLISLLSDTDTEFLFDNLKKLDTPPPVLPELAEKWFAAIRTLPSEAIVSAVNGFIYLAWAWVLIGPLTGYELEEILALFYHAVETIAETPQGMRKTIPNLVNTGTANPERFANILDKTRFAGADIIPALKRAEELQTDAPEYAKKTLIDFAVENGWYLLEDEYLPIWKAVQKSGETLFARIKALNTQPAQFKILIGFLETIKSSGKWDKLLFSAVLNQTRALLGNISGEGLEAVLNKVSSKTKKLLFNKAERSIFLIILGLKCKASTTKRTGQLITALLPVLGKGTFDYSELTALPDILKGKADEQILVAINGLMKENAQKRQFKELKPETIHRLITVIAGILNTGTGYTSGKVHSLEKLMGGVFASDDAASAIEALADSIDDYEGDSEMILSISTLLMRSTEGISPKRVFQKNLLFSSLLSLLPPDEKEKLFRGKKQDWVTALASEHSGNVKLVIEAVSQVRDLHIRSRFLEKIVIPLIMESGMNVSVFEEILTPAVFSYNREMTIEKRREEETQLLKKLFRAEDRTRSLDRGMQKLLDLPGFEGEEVESLLYLVRYLCESLSKQSAWLKKDGNVHFDKFLTDALPMLVQALIEYPTATVELAEGPFKELLKTIIPPRQTEEDHGAVLWQIQTAIFFFGEIMTRAIQHLGTSPELLLEYLEKIAERTVKSVKGKPTGIEFLTYVDELMQRDMVREMIDGIDAEVDVQDELHREKYTRPEDIYTGWQMIREDSFEKEQNLIKSMKNLSPNGLQMKIIRDAAGRISSGLSRSGYLEVLNDIDIFPGSEINTIRNILDTKSLLQVFREQELGGAENLIPEGQSEYFNNYAAPQGINSCRNWRDSNYGLIENIIIDIILLQEKSDGTQEELNSILDNYFEIIGYMGYEEDPSPYNTIAVLEKALYTCLKEDIEGTVNSVSKTLNRNLYKVMWQHRASSRINELTGNDKKLTKALLARADSIESPRERIIFLKKFGEVFVGVERIILNHKRKEIKSIRKDLKQLWLFDPIETPSIPVLEIIRNSVDTCRQYFLEISTGTGEVSESTAVSISRGMRKQYSDNALTIATLLRWSVDSQKEELLSIIEENPSLLETISRDTQLLKLIDTTWLDEQARGIIHTYAGNPADMHDKLIEFAENSENLRQ